MRAAGLNFRDVLIALGIVPGRRRRSAARAPASCSRSAPGSTDLAAGDRVMGLIPDGLRPARGRRPRLLAPMPDGWSLRAGGRGADRLPHRLLRAASTSPACSAGERVLVHAAAGGVGMAAVQLARHLGAEVYATASPGKWEALRALGIDEDHIASSRDLDFRTKFLAATGGAGVDVVLDSLAGEFVDASLGLLPRGGRFVEMGKTDIRDPERGRRRRTRRRLPGLRPRSRPGPSGSARCSPSSLGAVRRGALRHSPVATWDVRRGAGARSAICSEGRHVGKVVLTDPAAARPRAGRC